jgi:hypothetical protein
LKWARHFWAPEELPLQLVNNIEINQPFAPKKIYSTCTYDEIIALYNEHLYELYFTYILTHKVHIMTCNVGDTERMVRILVGLALVGFAFATNTLWAFIGAVPVLTGVFAWCPAYLPFGISTRK